MDMVKVNIGLARKTRRLLFHSYYKPVVFIRKSHPVKFLREDWIGESLDYRFLFYVKKKNKDRNE